MERKTFSMCNIEKHIKDFYKKNIERKDCNNKRGIKLYYENIDEISNHRKIYC